MFIQLYDLLTQVLFNGIVTCSTIPIYIFSLVLCFALVLLPFVFVVRCWDGAN